MIHDMGSDYRRTDALRFPFVLFDVGETLIAPRESFGAVYARVLAALGVVLPAEGLELGLRRCWAEINGSLPPGVDRYSAETGGESAYWLRFVRGTLARTPNAPNDEALAVRALLPLRDAFRDPGSWVIFDDVLPALASLRESGARLGVVSNWDSNLSPLLERLGLAAWFDAIVVSSLEGLEKPRPELFLRAVERLGGQPSQALHVGDTPELDGAGAHAAGVSCVIVDRHSRLPASLGALADLSTVPEIARGGSR
jgi:putative hydrolase of the HAD superfamily